MSKREVNLNGSRDSRLPVPALHFVSMPPERFDWSDRRPPQASPSPAGHAPAGLAEVGGAAPLRAEAVAPSGPPDLEVRTRRSVHEMKAGTTYSIGRDPKSDIVMTDSRVSWRHAVLRVDGGGWVVEDLGSTNGTFLGLQRLDRIEISAECVVRLGNPDDGPILRCAPRGAAAAQAAAGHPGTELSVPAAPAAPEVAQEPAPRHDSESWWQPPVPGGPDSGGPMPGGYPPGGPVSPPAGVPSRPPAPDPVMSRDAAPPRERPGSREHAPRHAAGAPDQLYQPPAPPVQPPSPQPGAGQPYQGQPYPGQPGGGQQYPGQGPQAGAQQAAVQPDLLPSVDRRPTA